MDDRTALLLQNEIRRLGRSLLQYVAEAMPYSNNEDRETLGRLAQLTQEERDALAALGRLLRRQHLPPPYLGPYPERFTSLNYLSLDRLLPLLIEDHRQAVAGLEKSVAAASDPEGRAALERLLTLKRRHLAIVEELAKVHPCVGMRL
jgi:hypothetical protein